MEPVGGGSLPLDHKTKSEPDKSSHKDSKTQMVSGSILNPETNGHLSVVVDVEEDKRKILHETPPLSGTKQEEVSGQIVSLYKNNSKKTPDESTKPLPFKLKEEFSEKEEPMGLSITEESIENDDSLAEFSEIEGVEIEFKKYIDLKKENVDTTKENVDTTKENVDTTKENVDTTKEVVSKGKEEVEEKHEEMAQKAMEAATRTDEAKEKIVRDKVLTILKMEVSMLELDWVDVEDAKFEELKDLMVEEQNPAQPGDMGGIKELKEELFKYLGRLGSDDKVALPTDLLHKYGVDKAVLKDDLDKFGLDLESVAAGKVELPSEFKVYDVRALDEEEEEMIKQSVNNYLSAAASLTVIQKFGITIQMPTVSTTQVLERKTEQKTENNEAPYHSTGSLKMPKEAKTRDKEESTAQEEIKRQNEAKAADALVYSMVDKNRQRQSIKASKERKEEEDKELRQAELTRKEIQSDAQEYACQKAKERVSDWESFRENLDLMNTTLTEITQFKEDQLKRIREAAQEMDISNSPETIEILKYSYNKLSGFRKEKIMVEKLGRFIKGLGYSLD